MYSTPIWIQHGHSRQQGAKFSVVATIAFWGRALRARYRQLDHPCSSPLTIGLFLSIVVSGRCEDGFKNMRLKDSDLFTICDWLGNLDNFKALHGAG